MIITLRPILAKNMTKQPKYSALKALVFNMNNVVVVLVVSVTSFFRSLALIILKWYTTGCQMFMYLGWAAHKGYLQVKPKLKQRMTTWSKL